MDEGQKGFGCELPLWNVLKLIQGSHKKHLTMLIVSAWISHAEYQGSLDIDAILGSWTLEIIVGLWPTGLTKISLQLMVEEATEIWDGSTLSTGLSESM